MRANFDRLIDGAIASLDQIPKSVEARDRDLLHRLLTHPYAFLASDPMALYDTLYGVTGILFVLAVPFVWRRFGAGYSIRYSSTESGPAPQMALASG